MSLKYWVRCNWPIEENTRTAGSARASALNRQGNSPCLLIRPSSALPPFLPRLSSGRLPLEASMSAMTRREFLRSTAKHAAVVGLLSEGARELRASPLGLPIGYQTLPVRE